MAKVKEAKTLIENFIKSGRKAMDALEELIQLFPAVEAPGVPQARVEAEAETPIKADDDEETQALTATLTEVRGILAEKARTGYRAEVKALLTAFGAKQLSDITDPTVLGVLLKEAKKIGTDG